MCPLRRFQVVELPEHGEVWMTGDLHDHRRNFDKLIRAADLGSNRHRHLILHELIHGDRFDADGSEGSWHMLYQAAELKCDYPNQVHFLLANHDLAQIHGEGIMKAGLSVCEAFSAGVKKVFNNEAVKLETRDEGVLSLASPGRPCPQRHLLLSQPPHRLADRDISTTPSSIASSPAPTTPARPARSTSSSGAGMSLPRRRPVRRGDQGRASSSPATSPRKMGYSVNGPQHLIIASDHNQGVFLPITLSKRYDMERLVSKLHRYAAIDE